VYIGEGRMTEGRILVSLAWADGGSGQWPGYLPLALHDQPVLAPGSRIACALTLDVGPAADLAASFPQRELELTARFTLDPVPGTAGGWVSALRAFPDAVLQVKRPAVNVSRTELDRLMKAGGRGSDAERVRAVGIFGALIRESESATRGALDYAPRRVDEIKLAREVMTALQAPSPSVRTAALEALRGVTFTKRTFQEVAPLLSDPDWLVRVTTLDVLAAVQGGTLRPVLEKLATADRDELVRRAARNLMGLMPADGR
jgi:HEAT repeat protein